MLLPRRKPVRRFFVSESGTSAIEFALLAPILFAAIFSAFEAGLMYTKISVMEIATEKVAREIYTGQAQENALTREDIIDKFCDEIDTVFTCDGNITLQVERLNAFTADDISDLKCVNTGDEPDPDDLPAYEQTDGGEVVYVRFCITTPLVIPSLKAITFQGSNIALQLPEVADGRYAITSSLVFRNEPFGL
jgi:Flp pilus assembly protein TadG